MQFVADKWYIYFTRITTVFALVFFIASIVDLTVPGLKDMGLEYGLSLVTLGLTGLHLLFVATVYRYVKRNSGISAATLILAFIYMMNLVNLIHSTGRLHSYYHGVWILLVLASGMFGPYAIIGFCFLTTLYMLLIATDIPGQFSLDLFSFIAAVAVYLIAVGGYYAWRRVYIDQESAQVTKLSGQLQDTKQQAEILVQSIKDGVIVTDHTGQIKLINPAAAQMLGWPAAEAQGIDVNLVLKLKQENGSELSDELNPFKAVLSNGQPADASYQLVKKDNSSIIVSLAVTPVQSKQGQRPTGTAAIIRDISVSRAEEAKRAEFISTASHEMRTPVAAIEGYLQLALNDKVATIDTKARSFLDKALDSTHHLGKLFQDLLTSAKAEDGRLVSHPVVVEMSEYLQKLTDGLKFAAEKKGLLLEFKLGAGQGETTSSMNNKLVRPLYYVHVDPDRLREVITNLFDNAVKYTERGKITVGLTGNPDVVQLFVRDTGAGIPKDDVPHLFQKFYRVDNSSTRTIGGTGLGLFICKQIVDLYHGNIWVDSDTGKGSTFYINLPRLSTQKATDLQKVEQEQSTMNT